MKTSVRTGDRCQLANVVLGVAVDIDEHGKSGEAVFTRIENPIPVRIFEFHTPQFGSDDRVPFGKRAIVWWLRTELRKQGHEVIAGCAGFVEHGNRKVEDVILLALAGTLCRQD